MSQIITGPDGVEHEFPDETSDDVIKSTLAKAYAPSDLKAGAKEFGRSVGEGSTGLLDIPSRLWTGVKNLPARLTNSSGDAAAAYAPGVDAEAFKANQPAPVALEKPNTYFNDTYNAANPPNPNFPGTRRAGNIVGAVAPTIVTGGLAGGFSALPAVVGDVAATTSLQAGAGYGARKLAEATGGDPNQAEKSAGLFTSLLPIGTRNLVETYNRNRLIDRSSPARLRAADVAGVEPDISLVGSDTAAGIGPLDPSIRARQQTQADAALKAAADARRGAPAPGPISRGDVGRQVVEVAQGGARNAANQASDIFNPVSETVGRGTRIDDPTAPTVEAALTQLRAPGTSTTTAPTVDYFQALRDADRARGGITWQQALAARSVGNAPLDRSTSFDRATRSTIKDAQTEELRTAAVNAGLDPDQFDQANTAFGQSKAAEKQLRKVSRPSQAAPPGEENAPNLAYNRLFGPGGETNSPLLQQFQNYADPNSLGTLLANNLELKARGPSVAGRPELPTDVAPNAAAPDWWSALPEETRAAYSANPAVRDQIDATMNVIRADARRSGGAPPQSGFDPTTGLAIAAAATGHPAALAGLTPKVAAYLNRRNLQDPDYVRKLVAGGSTTTPGLDLARILSSSVQTGR